jgi:hypothetical protein
MQKKTHELNIIGQPRLQNDVRQKSFSVPQKRDIPLPLSHDHTERTLKRLINYLEIDSFVISIMLGFGVNNENLFCMQLQIAQDLPIRNVVTINGRSVTYPHRPNAVITPPHRR